MQGTLPDDTPSAATETYYCYHSRDTMLRWAPDARSVCDCPSVQEAAHLTSDAKHKHAESHAGTTPFSKACNPCTAKSLGLWTHQEQSMRGCTPTYHQQSQECIVIQSHSGHSRTTIPPSCTTQHHPDANMMTPQCACLPIPLAPASKRDRQSLCSNAAHC